MPSVSLELPDDLKETFVTVNNDNVPNISTPVLIKNTSIKTSKCFFPKTNVFS